MLLYFVWEYDDKSWWRAVPTIEYPVRGGSLYWETDQETSLHKAIFGSHIMSLFFDIENSMRAIRHLAGPERQKAAFLTWSEDFRVYLRTIHEHSFLWNCTRRNTMTRTFPCQWVLVTKKVTLMAFSRYQTYAIRKLINIVVARLTNTLMSNKYRHDTS